MKVCNDACLCHYTIFQPRSSQEQEHESRLQFQSATQAAASFIRRFSFMRSYFRYISPFNADAHSPQRSNALTG